MKQASSQKAVLRLLKRSLKNPSPPRRKWQRLPSLLPLKKKSHHSKDLQQPSRPNLKDKRAASSRVARLPLSPRPSKRQQWIKEKKQRAIKTKVIQRSPQSKITHNIRLQFKQVRKSWQWLASLLPRTIKLHKLLQSSDHWQKQILMWSSRAVMSTLW